MAVIALDGELGCPHVVLLGLQNEADLVEGSCHGEVVDHAHGKLYVGVVLIGASGLSLVEYHLVVALGKDKVGVAARDDGGCPVFTRMTDNLDVEFLNDALLQLDVDVGILDVALALLQSFGGEVFEHFELIFGLADKGTQGYCDGQAYHSGAGMPTPMAFLSILGLSSTSMLSGRLPNRVAALAVHNATAIGSVQPMAGTTSLLTRAMMRSRVFISCMIFSIFWGKGTKIIQKE